MKKSFSFLLGVGLIFSVLRTDSQAEETPMGPGPHAFRVFGDRTYAGIYFSSPGEMPEELKFYSTFRSPEYHLWESNIVTFYTLPDDFSEEAYALRQEEDGPLPYPPEAEVLYQVDITENWELPLFIFLSQSGSQTPSVLGIEDSPDTFSWGEVMLFNGTEMILEGEFLNRRSRRIDFGLHGPYQINRRASVQLTTQRAGSTRTVFDGSLTVAADERLIFFLLPPLRPGSPEAQYRLVRDRKPQEPEKDKEEEQE
ncbi:MAG: hypothetical protein JJT75_02235 [Opitutales bacterium]|nr:hypothetical protein [Opitutales bacterium]MCH8541030.1 hypothetical protein [Opitutales bacterium]